MLARPLTALIAILVTGLVRSQEIFHGTSIIISPNHKTGHLADTFAQTANFYCFVTPKGYLSFRWYAIDRCAMYSYYQMNAD